MAKVQTLDWKTFMSGPAEKSKSKSKFPTKKVVSAAVVVGSMILFHGLPVFADPGTVAVVGVKAVTAMASASPDFSSATRPIKDLIFGAAHEIYFVFMAWGAMEALIGKPAQGFTRMKIATGAYILLYWVPWIVDQVNKVRPAIGY